MTLPDNALTLPEVTLNKINYAFFTNEDGQSEAGYLIDGKKTRNVNLFSPGQPREQGFDSADRVFANIQKCFEELSEGRDVENKFMMTSNYAKGGPLIVSCGNRDELYALQEKARSNLMRDDDPTNPERLGLPPASREALIGSRISAIKADSLIFKGIPDESIGVLGPSGDAHPIMMFDVENQIACYIAGAHAALRAGVLEQSVRTMVELGANPNHIQLVIGAGLGPRSYEFGESAPKDFALGEHTSKVLTPVMDEGKPKYLIDIKKLIEVKLIGILPEANIHDLAIDTMGFDLYDEASSRKTLATKSEFNGARFFSARRSMLEKFGEENSAAHNTVGRHAAGFVLKGS